MPHRNVIVRPEAGIPAGIAARRVPDRLLPARRHLARALLAVLATSPLAPAAVQAATIVVTSPADPGDSTTCTLRQAIVSMNDGAVAGSCVNSGGAFGDDTIRFADALFAGGMPTITLGTSLHIGNVPNGQGGIVSTHLHIDAGAGRKVVVERAAAAPDPFTPITAVMGYYNHNGSATGQLHLSGLVVRNGIGTYLLAKYQSPHGDSKYGVSSGGGLVTRHADVVIDRCEFRNNEATVGGALYVSGGRLSLDASIVAGNRASGRLGYSAAGWGGGISTVGSMTITNSTISGNTSTGVRGGSAIASMFGGVSLVNSTVSGNTVDSPPNGVGAAISLHRPYSPVSLLNSTFACNTGDLAGGTAAIYVEDTGHTGISAISTLFADTSNARCTTAAGREVTTGDGGVTVSGDHNLMVTNAAIDASAPFAVAPTFGDPLLGPLQANGGPTPTHAIGGTSPARNKGSNPGALGYDQRGPDYTRSVGGGVDIGAYEDQAAGLCGTAHGGSFASLDAGSPNLCASGASLQGFFGSGPWSWFCGVPSDPGNNEFCGASVLAAATLGIGLPNGVPTSSAVWGQPLRLKSTVSGPAGTPTGTVTFLDVTGGGAVPICTDVPLAADGTVVCDTAGHPIATGSRQLKAFYNGNGTYGRVSSSPGGIAVGKAVSATGVASQTPDPVVVGSPYRVVATVSLAAPSTAAPHGVVQVQDATDDLGCAYALTDAEPGCAITPLTPGAHALIVAFAGNDEISGSSVDGAEAVLAIPTTISLGAVPASATFGDSVSLQATLAFSGAFVPTGDVAFCDGGSPDDATFCASGTLLCASGTPIAGPPPYTATCVAPVLGAGTHAISARYAGDSRFAASVSMPASVEIAPAATTIDLSLSPATIVLGESTTVTATLSSSVPPQIATPTGTVEIDDGAGGSCTIPLPQTSCTLTPANPGEHVVSASYAGAANFAASSASTPLGVAEPPAQLQLVVDDGQAFARYGEALTYTVTLANGGNGPANAVVVTGTPDANFAGATLTWTCVASNGATCAPSGSGTSLADTATLPPASSATWTVVITVPPAASGATIGFSAAAGGSSGSDSDVLVVFRDGFDA